jgi:rhodanese-related sulfurtransferase
VRGTEEFWGPLGHIPTARNIPVAELSGRLPELGGLQRASIVLVCLTDKRSAKAAQTLRLAGYADISVLRSGMQQWSANGLPVETHAVSPAA